MAINMVVWPLHVWAMYIYTHVRLCEPFIPAMYTSDDSCVYTGRTGCAERLGGGRRAAGGRVRAWRLPSFLNRLSERTRIEY